MRILLTRPLAASTELAEILARDGRHQCVIEPMLAIENLQPEIDFAGAGAIVMTSANAVRAAQGLAGIARAKGLPLYCVGERSAQLADELGWSTIGGVGRDVDDLRQIMRAAQIAGPVIYLAGADRAGELAGEPVVIYRARAATGFSAGFLAGFADVEAVCLFSARTAQIFMGLVGEANLGEKLSGKVIYCLSMRIAEVVRAGGYGNVLVPSLPNRTAMIDLINA